jgi:hypothetical protein
VGDALEVAVAEFLEEVFEEHPCLTTFLGRTEWDHQLDDTTAAGFERREAATRAWLDRFSAFEAVGLTAEQQVDLALLMAHLREKVATADFAGWRRNATTYVGNGIYELFVHGTRPEAEATAAALDRLAQVPAALAAGRENLDPTLIDGELLRQWGIPNVTAQATFMRTGLGVFVKDAALRRVPGGAGRAGQRELRLRRGALRRGAKGGGGIRFRGPGAAGDGAGADEPVGCPDVVPGREDWRDVGLACGGGWVAGGPSRRHG